MSTKSRVVFDFSLKQCIKQGEITKNFVILFSINSMKETDKVAIEKLIVGFRNLPPKRKQQVLDFVEFCVWRWQK